MPLLDWTLGQVGGAGAQVNMTLARLRPMPPLPQRDLSDKQIIVTGANKGIGFQVALGLARNKCRLIMACRDAELAADAQKKIKAQTGNDKIEIMIVDFSSFQSVKKFIQDWKNRPNNRIDILINNAGSLVDQKTTTADDLEWTYQTNFLSPFYCTLSLLDCFAPDARILQGSSISIYASTALVPGNGNSDDLLGKKKEGAQLAGMTTFALYARSKAGLAVFSSELQKKLLKSDKTKNIFVAAAHPGVVTTDIWSREVSLMTPVQTLVNIFGISPSAGADSLLFLASDPHVTADPSNGGAYYDRRYRRWVPGWMSDSDRVKGLWKQWVKDSPLSKDPLPA